TFQCSSDHPALHSFPTRRSSDLLVAGGNPAKVNGKGYYVEATVFDAARPGMKIVDEEIFGPVLAVLTFENEAQGIELANRSMYGLAAGIWTKDIQKADRKSTRLN